MSKFYRVIFTIMALIIQDTHTKKTFSENHNLAMKQTNGSRNGQNRIQIKITEVENYFYNLIIKWSHGVSYHIKILFWAIYYW